MKSSLKIGMVMLNSFVRSSAIYCASALALLGCQSNAWFGGRAEYVEEIEKSLSFEGVELVRLRNVNGGVRINSWDKPEVFVKATKKVRANSEEKAKEYSQEVKIRIEKVGDAIEIITEHPKGHKPFFDQTFLLKSLQPRFIGSVNVEYDVTMPQRANLDANSTNGSINVAGIIGDMSANTTNGSVSIRNCEGKITVKTTNGKVDIEEVSGNVGAKTSNGSISAKLTTLDGESGFETTNGSVSLQIREVRPVPLMANTTNGSITVELPSNFAAEVEANTSNGHIRSDLPITVSGNISKTSLHGELNGGGPLMKLKTTNGNINISSPSF